MSSPDSVELVRVSTFEAVEKVSELVVSNCFALRNVHNFLSSIGKTQNLRRRKRNCLIINSRALRRHTLLRKHYGEHPKGDFPILDLNPYSESNQTAQ